MRAHRVILTHFSQRYPVLPPLTTDSAVNETYNAHFGGEGVCEAVGSDTNGDVSVSGDGGNCTNSDGGGGAEVFSQRCSVTNMKKHMKWIGKNYIRGDVKPVSNYTLCYGFVCLGIQQSWKMDEKIIPESHGKSMSLAHIGGPGQFF